MQIRRRCLYCGEKLPTDNPSAKYCKKSCKTLAYLQRKKETGVNSLEGMQGNESEIKTDQPQHEIKKEEIIPKPIQKKSAPTDFPQEKKFDFTKFVPEKDQTKKPDVSSVKKNPQPFFKRNLSLDQEMA